jgi:predicted membrane-bound spermidine synthase
MNVLILFFCSGATALIYEVLWSKYLTLMFGSTVQAQTVVLAIFMGGLAIGNRLFGRKGESISEPLATYGYLEIAIGLFGFFFNYLYEGADSLFISVGRSLQQNSVLLLAWKGVLSALLLLGPTILMGGTLPLLAAWLERSGDDPRRRVARFYSVNSLGAVAGAFLAAFYLVRKFGMVWSLELTALVNLVVGVAAIVITRRFQPLGPIAPKPVKAAATSPVLPAVYRHAGLLVAATGGISMGLEVLASRAVGLIVGASLQAFAIVLMAFILGIGLGSAVIAGTRAGKWDKLRTLYFLLLGASVMVGGFILFMEDLVVFYSQAKQAFASNPAGFIGHQALVGALAMAALGIPAAFLGAALPLAIRLAPSEGALGDVVGRLLTWNTIGAVAGVMLTGFVIMPLLGLRGSMLFMAVLLAAVTAFIASRNHSGIAKQLAIALGVVWIAGGLLGGEGWRYLMGSGLFRLRNSAVLKVALEQRKKDFEILYYKDAADATVAVEARRGSTNQDLNLRINGKPDASTQGDLSTQYLLAH